MDERKIKKIIQLIGLTELESGVYIALLDLGPSLANTISRKTGVHRRSIYDVMDRLIDKGLITYMMQNKKRYFSAANPERIMEIIDDKKDEINSIMPDLVNAYTSSKAKEETVFFRGKEGIKAVFDDQIADAKETLIIGTSKKAHELLKYYFPHYDKKRVSKNIKAMMIFDDSARNDEELKGIPLKEIRYTSKGLSGDTSTCIYGDKVAIIAWKDTPYAILIKDKEIAKSYRSYFEAFWGFSKP